MGEPVRIRRALLSVSDKTGLLDLARALARHGTSLLSTGGTARALREALRTGGRAVVLTPDPDLLGQTLSRVDIGMLPDGTQPQEPSASEAGGSGTGGGSTSGALPGPIVELSGDAQEILTEINTLAYGTKLPQTRHPDNTD